MTEWYKGRCKHEKINVSIESDIITLQLCFAFGVAVVKVLSIWKGGI